MRGVINLVRLDGQRLAVPPQWQTNFSLLTDNAVGGRGERGSEGDYSEKIKSEGVGKWIYADTDTGGNKCGLEETGKAGKQGEKLIGSRLVSETHLMRTLISWFCFDLASIFDPTRTWWGENCKRLLQRLAQLHEQYKKKEVGKIRETGMAMRKCFIAFQTEITRQRRGKKHSLKCAKNVD